MAEYSKLVRNGVPDAIIESGHKPITRILDEEEYGQALLDKMGEELSEFVATRNIEEISDLKEVINAWCDYMGIPRNEPERLRQEKAKKLGGFSSRIFLESVED